ncbi:MAG: PQQ-binding-like beta-propeller repeat protein [Verrucomicrobiales bacterium]
MKTRNFFPFASFVVATISFAQAGEFDWPQWQGPDRDAKSKETGLLQDWPAGGPVVAWKVTGVGTGYGAPAIANGRLYGMSKIDDKDEVVWARSEADGSEVWSQRIAAAEEGGMRQGIEGAGCTPTVDGDQLYVIGHGGDIACLQVSDGAIVWRKHLIKDFGGRLPTWRYNESPLIDGDKVICTPGGIDATMVALNKLTGEVVWKCTIPDDAGAPPAARPAPEESGDATTEGADFEPEVVIASGSEWKYFDKGASRDAGWMKPEFSDEAWSKGAAQLGYGDRDEATAISNDAAGYPTYYFRRTFEVKDPAKLKPLVVRLLRDDGAVVYLNGKEIVRDNMPEGSISHDTFASSTTPAENGFHVYDLSSEKLLSGKNVLAVEVHQADAESSDVSFDLELREKLPGKDKLGTPEPDRRRGGGFGGGGFGSSSAGYASAIAIDHDGLRQYVQLTAKTLAGISAADGTLLWRYDKPANRMSINCSTPIYQDGFVFGASAYNNGGGLAKLVSYGSGTTKAEEVWFSSDIENHHGGMVVIDDALYGANGGNGGGYLVCLDFKTGDVLWNERDRGKRRAEKGSIAFADGRIYYRTEDGVVLLIEPNKNEYIERGRFEQPNRTRQPAWTHPVIANGKLYIRDQDTLYSYVVKGPSK